MRRPVGVSNHRGIAAWLAEASTTRYRLLMKFVSRTLLVRYEEIHTPSYAASNLQPPPLPPLSTNKIHELQNFQIAIESSAHGTNAVIEHLPTICDKALQPLDSGLSTARQAGFYPALPFLFGSSTGNFDE